MAINVICGGEDATRALMYGVPDSNVSNLLQQQYYQIDRSLFRDTSFIDKSMEQFMKVSSIEAIKRAESIIDNCGSLYDLNDIKELSTITEMQLANPVMQRYIMANPIAREYYHDNRCDGYFGQYEDIEFNFIGEDHTDYRRVMDGQILDVEDIDNEELENTAFRVKIYMDLGEDPPLTDNEKFKVRRTWEYLENMFLDKEEDPTDLCGNYL